ncbi:MAG: Asp23/Gls24 family envelope stress response protein [Gaiellaceae bacterium]
MEREEIVVSTSELGRVAVSSDAVAQIVRIAALESYGVVGLAGGGRWARLLAWRAPKAIDVQTRDDGLVIELRVVVEHGLRLAEVAAKVRSRVEYELGRMVGIPIAHLEVHIEQVRSR